MVRANAFRPTAAEVGEADSVRSVSALASAMGQRALALAKGRYTSVSLKG